MLSKEISAKVKGINEETVSETVNQFYRHGNTFLLLELINLKREIKNLREELQRRRDSENHSLRALVVP